MSLNSPLQEIRRPETHSTFKPNLFSQRIRRAFNKRFALPLTPSRQPPWFHARGVAVGLIVGLGVPIGGQVLSLALLRLVFRFNTVMAFAFTWVNNPLTLLPVYYGYYCFGSYLLGNKPTIGCDQFHQLFDSVLNAAYFWASMRDIVSLGRDLLLRWALGAVVVAGVAGIVGYVTGYGVSLRVARKWAERLKCETVETSVKPERI
jgi:uncharacterized protein